MTLTQVSGNDQAASVGSTVADPLVVRAVDQNGVTVPGVPLEWEVLSASGSLVSASTATDQAGLGQAVFQLGSAIGTYRVSVTVGSQTPTVFTLTATAAPASLMAASSGNNQSGTVGANLANPLVVVVTDGVNNPKAGVPVTFTVASGGGSVTLATVLSNAQGLASATWKLGTTAGAQAVVATSTGLPAVTFNATAVAGAPAAILVVSGNGQVGSPGVALPVALKIRINDQYGNGVPGVAVTFTTTADDGTVTPSSGLTAPDGTATGTWTLGPTGGLKSATAAAGSLSVQFTAGSSVTYASVSAGGRHTCAVSTDNVLYCWGYNGDGQLGLGASASGSGPVYAVPQPSAVTGALTFAAVNSGAFHTCGITLSLNPYCWGKNVDGRVGNNNTVQANAPAHLTGPNVFRQVSAGGTHTCGITPADRLFCWGAAADGQVGDGIGTDPVLAPAEVVGGNHYGQVSAGGLHACAIADAGATLCWGVNLKGQLGDGSTTNSLVPVAVTGGAPAFVRVSAGAEHTCALTVTGEAWCWGDNTYGQLGDASNSGSTAPVAVAGGMTFESITSGMYHTCGVVGTPTVPGGSPVGGAVYCWGRNNGGQLGTGNQVNSNAPMATTGGLNFLSVSAGDLASCGISTTNRAYCWGDNQYGQLGDGTTTRRLAPTKVAFQP